MKYFILITSFILSITNTEAQSITTKQPNIEKMDTIPSNILDDQIESFNIQWLEDNCTSILPSGKFPEYSYRQYVSDYYLLLGGNRASGYYLSYIKNDSYYVLHKDYYPNGKIKEKGMLFNNTGINKVGKWYSYNENGELIKVEDFDKNFEFSFDDAIQYCIDHNIPVEKGAEPYRNGGHKTRIERRCLPTVDSCVYTIVDFTGGANLKFIELDGKTGKVLGVHDGGIIDCLEI